MFLFDNCFNHFAKAIDNLVFLFPERRLVRNLEEVAHRLGPFTVKTTHRETNFAHRLDDLINQVT
jgi:hypothetical protein